MRELTRLTRIAWRIASWDIACEIRRPASVISVALFGIGALVALRIAVAGGSRIDLSVAAGGMWIVLLLGAMLGTSRAMAIEREEGTFDQLLLVPGDRSSIYLGKTLSATLQGLAMTIVIVPLSWVMLASPPSLRAALLVVGIAAATTLGFAAVGVLGGLLSIHARGRELLHAAIFVPLTIPAVIIAVTATLAAIGLQNANEQQLLGYLLCYDGIFIAAGFAATPLLVVE